MRKRKQADLPGPSNDGPWQKSATTGLYRFRSSGTYFARVRVGGKLIRESLHTKTYSVAVLRLNDLVKERRGILESAHSSTNDNLSFGQAAEILLRQVDANPAIKKSTRDYRRRCLAALKRSWTGLADLDVRKITPAQCRDWAGRFARDYSPTMYNNTVGTLRMVFDVAVESGLRFANPAAEVTKVKVPLKHLRLPSADQFQGMVRVIAEGGGRYSRDCADLVCLLAYSGLRKGEGANLTWAHCEFERKRILVAGDPKEGTKNREMRLIPMNSALESLLLRLRQARSTEPPSNPVMKVHECQRAMDRACKLLEIERITHHDLRHFFATTCIESGIDIPTVSRWLGHKDGGALAMRVYGHLRDQHSQAMAQKVTFGIGSSDPDKPNAQRKPQS